MEPFSWSPRGRSTFSATGRPGPAPKPGPEVHLLTHQLPLAHTVGTFLLGVSSEVQKGGSTEIKSMPLDVRCASSSAPNQLCDFEPVS